MKSNEASSGHHQSKVVLTNQTRDSKSKVNLSGLKKNTVSNKKPHQSNSISANQTQGVQSITPTNASISSTVINNDINKETNFEYDDNEWEIGIGNLIVDLDADIEKSSVYNQLPNLLGTLIENNDSLIEPTQLSTKIPSTNSSSSTFDEDIFNTPKLNKSRSVNVGTTKLKKTNCRNKGSIYFTGNYTKCSITPTKGRTTLSTSSKHHTSTLSTSSSASLPSHAYGHHQYHYQKLLQHHHRLNTSPDSGNRSKLLKHSVLLCQLNSNKLSRSISLSSSETIDLKHHHSRSSNGSISSNSSCSAQDLDSSKSGRSSSSSIMSSTTSNTSGKSATKLAVDHQATLDKGLKMKIKRTKPGTKTSEAKHEIVKAEQNGSSSLSSINSDANTINSISNNKKHSTQSQSQTQQVVNSNMSQQQQQGTKRGSSGHRRDKTKEKTAHHNPREKNEHNSSSGNSSSSTSSGSDRVCKCTLEIQANGISQTCSNISCIRSRTADHLRLSNQNNSSACMSTSNSLFPSNSNTVSSLSNNSNTPNMPTTPSSKGNSKISPTATNTSLLTNIPLSTSPSGSGANPNNSISSSSNCSYSSDCSMPSNMLKSQLQPTVSHTSLVSAASGISSSVSSNCSSFGNLTSSTASSAILSSEPASLIKDEENRTSSPPAKRHKCGSKDMVDVCVGTSVGTITEPDCLGPCEPGTSVTLEGIVWHETEGGVLVVNVTWRGKTYVGTLIDCTKHDWAPPRFCDSPTEEFDSRTQKGRGKRGRNSTLFPVNDLSNFTETRTSMHSKLRNGGTKGRGNRGPTTISESSSTKSTSTTTPSSSSGTCTSVSSNTPSTSPVAFLPPRLEKRKSKDESLSPVNSGSSNMNNLGGNMINSGNVNSAIVNNGTSTTENVVNPMTGLNMQIPNKKCKSTVSPCEISPVLLECPEQDCSKKYKHANGLKYHQSHAHGSVSSMDEDSSQPPESPQRIVPPTTPSPVPTIQSIDLPPVTVTNSSLHTSTITPSNLPQLSVSCTTPNNVNHSAISTTKYSNASSNVSQNSASSANLLMTACVTTTTSTVSITTHAQLNTIKQPLFATSQINSHTAAVLPPAAGGSITAGISGQTQLTLTTLTNNQTMLGADLSGSQNSVSSAPVSIQSQTNQAQNQTQHPPQQATSSGIPSIPMRCDTKNKSGVLRFGPLPIDEEINQRLVPVPQSSGPLPLSTQSTISVRSANVGVTGGVLSMQSITPATIDGTSVRTQNCTKLKKSRKSPGPSEYDVAAANRAEDVRSPAYSDISDDSTPVADPSDLETKRTNENAPEHIGPISGYGMYPYYPGIQHQPPYYSTEHTGNSGLGHSPVGPNAIVDYKNKEPPLDLMNKSNLIQQQPPSSLPPGQQQHTQQLQSGDCVTIPNKDILSVPSGKIMQHFYPYGYVPTGFSYNLDPTYGPVTMISDDNKLSQQQSPGQTKEERIKENPVMSEYTKIAPQLIPTKLIKSEPNMDKDIKTESGHSLHAKDQPGQQSGHAPNSAYSGMFQRHGINTGTTAQPPQHINREEDSRRLFNYSEQRRSSTSSNSSTSNMNSKDEPHSPSNTPSGHPCQGSLHGQSPSQTTANISQQLQKISKTSSSSQHQIKQQKDIKTEDKELLKVKQEGQKPTMETQGPPPPPTSQYYPHSLYMSASPFPFDPNHHVYRNMLVPSASYSAPPYHLQIPRYTSPEDLSRNPSTKALDLLQHHASQYYNSHKIHELREGVLKSPSSNVKVSVSSPNLSQQSSQNPNICIPSSNSSISSSGLPLQHQQQLTPQSTHPQQSGTPLQPTLATNSNTSVGPVAGCGDSDLQKDSAGQCPTSTNATPQQSGQQSNNSRSPPPQRHVHTHHHTHVGLGYPMFQAPYGAAVLASQQAAAAVTVISPFQTGPTAK